MLQIGICDDEAPVRESLHLQLEGLLHREAGEFNIFEFSSGEGLLAWLQKHPGQMDLLFLDIEMGGQNGMDTARELRKTNRDLLLVFVTGFADFVFDGYEVGALDYLLKPAQPAKLQKLLRRAVGLLAKDENAFFSFSNTGGSYRVAKKDILFFYSDKRQVLLVTAGQEHAFYARLDEVAAQVGAGFVRIHQRYLANAQKLEKMEQNHVVVAGRPLPVSRACRGDALLAMGRNMLE